MAQYKVHQPSYLPDGRMGIARVFAAGEIVSVPDDLIPGPHMEPVDAAGRKAFLKCVDKAGNYVSPPMRKIEEMPLATFEGFDIKQMMEAANG